MTMKKNFLSEEEISQLMDAIDIPDEMSADDAEMSFDRVLAWATEMVIGFGLFEQALAGLVTIQVVDGEVLFSLSDMGNAVAEDILLSEFRKELEDL